MKIFVSNESYSKEKIFFEKGKGSLVFSKNRKFIDLSCGSGTLLLGHSSKIFKSSLRDFLKLNISNFSSPNKYAVLFAHSLKKIYPQFSRFVFCNSGAESNIKAIRLARAITNKNLIISVSGSWHGSIDQFLFKPDNRNRPKKISDGVDSDVKKNIIYIPYNDEKRSLKILNRYKKKVCCIIIEPIQGCLPTPNGINYLKFLDNYCKKNNLILLFDEIITGIRVNCSSVQNELGIKSDISTFGKVFGGGMPIGILAFSNKIYQKLLKKKKKVYFGGTFSGNALSMYLANKTLTYILKNKKKIFKKLELMSQAFENELNIFIKKNNLNAQVFRYKSILRIVFSKQLIKNRSERDLFEKRYLLNKIKFVNFLKENAIRFPSNGVILLSYSMEKKQLKYTLDKIKIALKKFT